jgi:phosphoserine phosphatase
MEQVMGTNERLGLPVGKMRWVVVAFDMDGTLIDADGTYQPHIIGMLTTLAKFKNVKIVVWSGGGLPYAKYWGHKLGLDQYVWKYASKTEHAAIQPDIAIDDIQDTAIGTVNLIVRNK